MQHFAVLLWVLLACFVFPSSQQESECDQNKLCPRGCCSSAGFCGYGPDYCGGGCLSTCGEKSECNPGWKSSEWSEHDKCPLNVCCSDHGFCGYTEEFCGDKEVDRPSCSPGSTSVDRLIGYYEAFALRGRPCMTLAPERIPFGQYTHLIFSFATINPSTFEISAGDGQEPLMSRINALKLIQPDLEIWVAVGGWAFNDPGPTQSTFSDMAGSKANTDAFLSSLGKMMNKYGFDGVDIDWEYPVAKDRNGRPEDYENIVTFMQRLRSKMNSMRKGTSMALPASYWYLQNFDLPALEPTVDWFNIMSYDMHGSWDIDNEWTGPWANSHTNMTEIQLAFDLLWRNDVSPEKVTMGMSFYSRTFTLTDPGCSSPGCQVSSAGDAGRCSDTAGVLLHQEIMEISDEEGVSPQLHREEAVRSISWGNQWTTFDDVATWRLKANQARSQCISGFMVWAISQDDAKGTSARALNQALGRQTPDVPTFEEMPETPAPAMAPDVCRWTSCFDGCPSGMEEVQREGHEEIMMDSSICKGVGHGYARFCCPKSSPKPTCRWRGHKNSGSCKPGCNSGEVEVGTLKTGCSSNHQSACCDRTEVTDAWGQCMWSPCVDDPESACSTNLHPYFVVASETGSGGTKKCSKDRKRAFCCSEPPPDEFSGKCRWVPKAGKLKGSEHRNTCEGACPDDYIQVALARDQKLFTDASCEGNLPYCCPEPRQLVPRDEEERDDFGSKQVQEFQMLIDKYMEDPTCPARDLHPPMQGHHPHLGSQKRSLISESSAYEVLQGRATDCTMDNWNTLVNWAVLMFAIQQAEFDPIRAIWNDDFADAFDEELQVENLEDFLLDFPMYEERGLIESVLYNAQTMGPAIRRMRGASEIFCVEPIELPNSRTSSLKPRQGLTSKKHRSHGSRAVSQNYQDEYTPTLETVWAGIEDGDLSLHYARWQWASGTNSGSGTGRQGGPFLELAYWIGSEPGVDSSADTSLDIYRDMTPGNSYLGRWVVFHLHIDYLSPWYARFPDSDRTYFAIVGFRFFHAHIPSSGPNREWRVNTNNRANNPTPRDQWFCRESGLQTVWYVGREPDGLNDPNSDDDDIQWYGAMNRWGQRLLQEGYMESTGVGLIMEGDTDRNDQLIPNGENPLRLIMQGENSASAGNTDPYTINWLVNGNGRLDFFTPPPPPPRP